MLVETRPAPGSAFEEIRVTRTLTIDPRLACEAIWARDLEPDPWLPKGELLKESDHDRWYYERVVAPLVAERDYTLHIWREPDVPEGCVVRFDLDNDRGPPLKPGVVRMAALRGSWVVTATAEGVAKVVYTLFNDPGGNIPALLSRGSQRSRAIDWVQRTFASALKPSPR